MCHNSASESDQIDKCIENGMPHKIIKTVKYTMRRRVAEAAVVDDTPKHVTELETRQKDKVRNDGAVIAPKGIVKASRAIQMKCPFSHGLKTPTPTTSPSDSPPLGPLAETAELQIPKLFGGLIHRQSIGLNDNSTADDDVVTGITNLSGHGELIPAEEDIYNDDILAKSTQFTKKLTFHMQQAIGRLQESKIYTLLTKTTQPAHVLAICIPSFVLLTIWPEIIDGTQHKHAVETKDDHNSSVNKNYTLALIAYLGAFSTHFGSQIWMTFVSGLSLYFSLPRHMFGQCQQILFPKYFAMNGVLSITMLILFVKFFVDSWTMPQCVQLGALSLTGAIEVLVRLYLAPPLLNLMHEKYKIEGTIGSGKEVGSLVQGDLIQCPHYQRIHKAFRRIHMTVAIGNLITMAASCLHLYYIAGKIQISI